MTISLPRVSACLFACVIATTATSCGGAPGGAGPTGSGQGLVLFAFAQDSTNSVALNQTLEFLFSEPVDAATIDSASVQIREGPSFGLNVPGEYRVDGSRVYFDPRIPNLCDRSDGAFNAGTQYKVTLVGNPEEFSIGNTRGQPLQRTYSLVFTTREEADPRLFNDQIPNTAPDVVAISPADGWAAAEVAADNAVVLTFSENLDPCTVSGQTVRLDMYERGDATQFVTGAASGNPSGFVPFDDQVPGNATTWGGNATPIIPVQRVPANVILMQDLRSTEIRIVPHFGKFPENALLVVRVSTGIRDLGGSLFGGLVASFTTENVPSQSDSYVVENEGETPYLAEASTADINTARSPGLAQGFAVVAGDGDNGGVLTAPSGPNQPPGCSIPRDVNDGVLDHFLPLANVVLDTGSTPNTCPNQADGSRAVVWEFASFTIPAGITVFIVGRNAAIILVNGPVKIESGGTLSLRGGNGSTGTSTATPSGTWPSGVSGGIGVAGGGDGGASQDPLESQGGPSGSWPKGVPFVDDLDSYGEDGWEGFGSPLFPDQGGHGGGQGNAAAWHGNLPPPTGPYEAASCGAGGGGGGHGAEGATGGAAVAPSGNSPLSAPARGEGGEIYDDNDTRMLTPSAGSGGGAGGYHAFPSYAGTSAYAGTQATGGGGGAGGGFVDITSSLDIAVNGTIDASGGRGGTGGDSYFCDTGSAGGGGGGSGGGIRLLTPGSIDVSGATITTAGGAGGLGGNGPACARGTAGARNDGGAGGNGRIVLEDADSVISGLASATMAPAEGDPGFYRGVFDIDRFVGGGLRTTALSDLFVVGAFNPTFHDPASNDFIAGIPTVAAEAGATQIVVEAQGFQMLADGAPDMASSTGWRTVGHFQATPDPDNPSWVLGQTPLRSPENVDPWGITHLDGCEYIQIRFSFILREGVGLEDPGPFVDRWTIRFDHDQ
jgi:hypothetical protein